MKKIDILQGMLECLAVARTNNEEPVLVYYTAEQSKEDADKLENIEIILIGKNPSADVIIANHRANLKYVRCATPDAMYSTIYYNQTIYNLGKIDISFEALEEMLDYIKQSMNKRAE